MSIIWLNEEVNNLNGKAYCINKVSRNFQSHEIFTQHSFLIPNEIFKRFLDSNGLRGKIDGILRNYNGKNAKEISYSICELIYNSNIPEKEKNEIANAYSHVGMSDDIRKAGNKALNLVSGKENQPVVLIPNIKGVEISPKIWNVRGKESLVESVKNIYASLFSPEAIYSMKGSNLQNDFGIIVEQFSPSEKYAILYTQDPRDGGNKIIVESNLGTGSIFERSTPDLHIIDKNSGSIELEIIAKKDFKHVVDDLTGDIVSENVPEELRRKSALNSSELTKIIQISLRLEEIFNRPLKMEFSVEKGRIKVVDIHSFSIPADFPQDGISGSVLAKGIPSSFGTSSGELKKVYSSSDLLNLSQESLIMISKPFKEIIPHLDKINGIVSKEGSISSPVSQMAREKGIPMIINVEVPDELEGENIHLNAFSGDIINFEDEFVDEKHYNGLITGIDIKVHGARFLDEADGCLIMENTMHEDLMDLADRYYPNKIWAKKHPDSSHYSGHCGIIYEPYEMNTSLRKPFGVLLKDFGSVLQLEDYLSNIDLIVLDVDSLMNERENGGKAVLNAVKRISEIKQGELCILLKEIDPELIEKLIFSGVDSFSISPKNFNSLKKIVAKKEKKFLLRKLGKI